MLSLNSLMGIADVIYYKRVGTLACLSSADRFVVLVNDDLIIMPANSRFPPL